VVSKNGRRVSDAIRPAPNDPQKSPQFNKIAGYFVYGGFWHGECTRELQAIEELSKSIQPEETMRSELIFGALTYVPNRFLLTSLASMATRRFHRPNTRIEDTANEVFERFTHNNPLAGVPSAASLQSFPSVAQGETRSFDEDLEQSVA
jgi:hypothetical protein